MINRNESNDNLEFDNTACSKLPQPSQTGELYKALKGALLLSWLFGIQDKKLFPEKRKKNVWPLMRKRSLWYLFKWLMHGKWTDLRNG